ncbi:MarR family transcriptional regulator [Tropicibacter sp. R15_0]|uniref:MarR family winged helix-turn-helix transcriptional regulator n=1 Tax=Tropicibacter sp. R15_0 TaxID=2821101 RepID=UPI001AD99549|nr:MarR family transcriptional regulator [Tropicibacter sp. R15_0]MBO9466221.1 MarR family transcriptional regulator [Tropicibacter sp. R15_0]
MDHVDKITAQWNAARPDLDVGPMGPIGRMARLSQHLHVGHAALFAKHGLNNASFDVLATLRRAGAPYALTPKALLAQTMVTSGTMTNRLDRLEQAGLITRNPDPNDGRGFLVQLTDHGFDVIEQAVSAHVANQAQMISALTCEERELLNTLLKKWLGGFETAE